MIEGTLLAVALICHIDAGSWYWSLVQNAQRKCAAEIFQCMEKEKGASTAPMDRLAKCVNSPAGKTP